MKAKVMLSGIQPTGDLHLGNYIGAIKNWRALLDEYYGYFFIADLHAMTVEYDVSRLQPRILQAAKTYLAAGFDDADRCVIFAQSRVSEHAELAWILNTLTPIAELERMTQFKDKAREHAENINAGLFTYPTLMAADILLYRPDIVPVGEDQTQHIELTRLAARKFNNRFGGCFSEPAAKLSTAARLYGLDGEHKMSKSKHNHIPLSLTAEETETLILQKAVTDPQRVKRTDPGNPDVCNIYAWHAIFSSPEERNECARGCKNASIGCVDCKRRVAKNINAELAPIRERMRELEGKDAYVIERLREGEENARARAKETMRRVRALTGLTPPWE